MKSIILGTDWWDDCDDAVALRILTNYVQAGKVELLGIGINACMPDSVASLRGFLEADGIRNIPIGLDCAATDYGDKKLTYQFRLARELCPNGSNDDAMDAVRLYRKLLVEADEPVEIIEIGFLQVIANLLKTESDDLSTLNGLELVKRKVRKVWAMAGKWDEDGGRENNFCRNERSRTAGAYVCAHCPVPITFLGFEIGVGIRTGCRLNHSDHLYRVLLDHGSAEQGRHSWDPMTVLMALIGDEVKAGYETVRGYATVDVNTGANHFRQDSDGPHCYVIKAKEDEYYQRKIEKFL